ncbi:MAG: tetratricopeptide repeat protein [Terriglobia bacterium]
MLPFENLTGDPTQDYFSDGLTEEVITQLGRQDPDHLGVIARTSVMRYKHGDESIGKIARELGVEYILEGSVRRSGDRVRISAQLIKASDQSHVWSQSYERPVRDVLAVQESVAREVKEHIANRLDRQGLAARSALRPVDPAAYRAYLEGLYFLNRRDVADYQKAIEEFEAAIRKDRSYALAYAALADTHILLTLEGYDAAVEGPKARSAALKAVALDPSLAESHTALAAVDVLYRWDWRTAEQEFKLALRANPNYELAHHWFAALVLGPQGRYPEAIAEMKLAQRLDPVSLIVNTDLGWTYFIAGRRRGAFAQYQKTLRLDQRFVPVHYRLFEYYVSEGMYAQAVHEAALDAAYSGNPEAAHKIEQEYRARGFPRFLASQIEAAKQGRSRIGRLGLARNDALLGRNDEAIGTLSTLVDTRDPAMIYLRLDPELASLHSDPRFQQLERRCGLVP